jgi:hypothetical protein
VTKSATTPLMPYSISGQPLQAVDVKVGAHGEQERQAEHPEIQKHDCSLPPQPSMIRKRFDGRTEPIPAAGDGFDHSRVRWIRFQLVA